MFQQTSARAQSLEIILPHAMEVGSPANPTHLQPTSGTIKKRFDRCPPLNRTEKFHLGMGKGRPDMKMILAWIVWHAIIYYYSINTKKEISHILQSPSICPFVCIETITKNEAFHCVSITFATNFIHVSSFECFMAEVLVKFTYNGNTLLEITYAS